MDALYQIRSKRREIDLLLDQLGAMTSLLSSQFRVGSSLSPAMHSVLLTNPALSKVQQSNYLPLFLSNAPGARLSCGPCSPSAGQSGVKA